MARPTTKRASDFGARLTAARKTAGLTQIQLAERLGVSQQMIDYYERRANNPTADFVRKAAAILNVSVDELVGHSVKVIRKSGPPSRLQQLTEQLSELPRNKQKVIVEMLEGFLKTTKSA